MTSITITLPDEQARKLQEIAGAAGVEPGELLRSRVEQWLQRPPSEFAEAAAYVLTKNAELYQRLA